MGNTPRSRSDGGEGGGGISLDRVSAGPSNGDRTRSSGSPAVSASVAAATRSKAKGSAMDAPRELGRGGPDLSGLRSSRNAPAPSYEGRSARPANAMAPTYDRPQNRVVEEVRRGVSEVVKNSASNSWSRYSNTSASSKRGTKEQVSEHARNGNATSSSKKRKKMDSRTYLKLFKPFERASATDIVVATPDRVGKDTPSGYVADINIVMPCEGAMLVEKNKSHSSDAVYKGLKSPISGLHETSETRVGQHTSPFSEVQLHKLTAACPQNRATESSPAVEARDQFTGPTRNSFLSSSQSVPISPICYEVPKIMLGDGGPISSQKEDSASRQFKVTPSDETDGNSDICVACGIPGTIDYRSCDGKGCNNRYHISCLDPSLEYLSPGIWFCTSCTKKRFHFGLHSIVDGIESVWDVKEAKGIHNGKQYFVKYKNLAHVHNRWVPEGDINDTPGGPDLLSLFNKRTHTEKTFWRHEWTKPHRLLRKRLLMPPKLADDFVCSLSANVAYCNVEWLVKWRGLGYDRATWELENSPCLCTREADELKKNYENRHEAAKKASICKKTEKVKQTPFQKLERLPDRCHPDFDNDHLCSVNQLREFWYKSHGAILVDDKEHVMKTILFTMSVLSDVCQPFLIVTTPASLSLWEAQFNILAPFINVVVYDGGKDKLKIIQDLEFYENGSCIMLQVLLSHPDAILEDIESIACIGWEAVIVDYYQKSALKYLEKLKKLPTDFRVLLLSSPIQDNLHEYMKLLSFLNSGEQENNNYIDTADALVMSKLRFTRHIAYERQADSSKNLEHWVPAYLSQLQLENYCSILLSDSSVLQSQIKTDSARVLCDILMSLSKCCDHPYLIDKFLQNSHVNNHDRTESIDTRVHACGKLVLLDKMLKETWNKRLRVIILFQSDGSGGNPLGDILEGVVRQRFGAESYECVEFGALRSRKQVAVNMFNDKTKGRFVFLIENHACLPSIELSSVDVIIIYNSNWNPLNDLKALRRIKIESRFKYPSIFRLYSPFTIEEKKLMLAKQGMPVDNIQDIVCSLSHSLISWGASFLFTRLDELQQDNYASKSSERDSHFVDKVISEFLTNLATSVEDSTKINSGFISKASMSGEFYSRSITLIGEKEGMPALDGDPSNFWLSLLDGRSPYCSYISEPPQSSNRMLPNMEEPAKNPAEEANEARSKRRKVGEITGPSSKSHDDTLPENCTTSSPALQPLDDVQPNLGVKKLMGTPKSLHNRPNQKVSKLVKVFAEGQELISVQETNKERHLSNDEPLNMTVEKKIDLVDSVFSLREKSILDKQQLEISDLETHTRNKVIRLKEVCNLVLEHIRRSHIDEMTRNDKTKLIIQWFTMLVFAFLEHIRLQHNKLRALQFDTWSKERKLKENLHQQAKSGQLDDTFDQCIALPDSNFVIEDFIHESCIVESSVSDCQQPSNEGLLTEITLLQNVVPSETISTQPVQNEPVEISVDLGRGPASEALDISENNIHCSSNGIGLQNVGCSANTIPANNDLIGQECSAKECRNTEHVEGDNISNPTMSLGNATSLVREANANGDGTLDTDQVRLGLPILASPQILTTLSVSREVGIHANPSTMSAPQSVGTIRHPPVEAEPTNISSMSPQQSTDLSAPRNLAPSSRLLAEAERPDMLGTQAVQDLQPEMQITSLPAQQSLAIQRDLPAEAEHTGVLRTEAAGDLQPPSTSMQDQAEQPALMHVEPAEAEGPSVLDTTAALSEERGGQIGFQTNVTPGPEQPTQLLPPDTFLFDRHPISSSEPLKNELEMIKRSDISVSKAHEQKRSLLLIEYNQEMEKVRSKYESLLQKEDSTYLERKAMLAGIHKKVAVHQLLAEKFRETFNGYSAAQVGSTSPVMEQPLQFSSSAQTAASLVASSSARPPVLNPFPSPGPYVPPSSMAQPSSPWDVQIQSILRGNLYGATLSPFSPVVVSRGSYGYAGTQSHGVQPQSMLLPWPRGGYRSAGAQPRVPPIPRLHQLRTQSPYAIHTNQQHQLPVGPQVWSQFLPGVIGNTASTTPWAGAILTTSMAPTSFQQAMASASSSHPGLPGIPGIPGIGSSSMPHLELLGNFAQPSSPNPILMMAGQSTRSMFFPSTSDPPNATQMAGVGQSGYESTSSDARRPANDTAGAAAEVAAPQVTCLSDDE